MSDTSTRAELAQDIIKKYALLATGAGLIPITGMDIAASTAVQVRMINEISDLYDIKRDDDSHRIVISSFLSSVTVVGLASALKGFIGSFQGIGQFGEELTKAAINGFFAAAIGNIFVTHYENGGTPDTLTLRQYFDHFAEMIEQGELNPSTFTGLGAFSYLR